MIDAAIALVAGQLNQALKRQFSVGEDLVAVCNLSEQDGAATQAADFGGSNYPEALKFLSSTVPYFQSRPVFNHQSAPDLDNRIDKLTLEIENLSIADTRAAWRWCRWWRWRPGWASAGRPTMLDVLPRFVPACFAALGVNFGIALCAVGSGWPPAWPAASVAGWWPCCAPVWMKSFSEHKVPKADTRAGNISAGPHQASTRPATAGLRWV